MNKKYFIGAINILITIICSFLVLIGSNTILIISNIQAILIILGITIISLIIIRLYFTKKQSMYNLIQFICFLMNIILIYNIYNINNQTNYVENLITNKYEYKIYDIYVLKNTKYDNLEELINKNIGITYDNKINIEEYLNNKGEYNIKIYTNKEALEEDLKNGKIQAYIGDKKTENANLTIIQTIKIKKEKK